jgi:hypothetical protein
MQPLYYVNGEHGQKDGPYDLIAIMRRIRMHQIDKDSLIYIGDETLPRVAQEIPDIALFFETDNNPAAKAATPPNLFSLIHSGWEFVQEHYTLSIFSGVILLLALLAYFPLTEQFGTISGGIMAWVIFVLMHNIYLVFALRSHRGQMHGGEFISTYIIPILPTLLVASLVLALMIAGGILLLVVPGVIVSLLYIYTPFLIYDRRYGVVEALYASRLLIQKHGKSHLPLLAALVFLHLVCLVLIVPIPVTLPIYAAALSALYEDILSR